MNWLRKGDNSASHPAVLAVKALGVRTGDPRLWNEVRGFLDGCFTESASHKTDYLLTEGMVIAQGGEERWEDLLKASMKCGLITKVPRRREWMLIEDPDFAHIRRKADTEWEATRRSDNRNDRLVGPVRLRDGDECRYCGRVVRWGPGHRRGEIFGTYDHNPPRQAGTIETLFVVCGRCNSQRNGRPGEAPPPDSVRDSLPGLRPAPTTPYYSPESAEYLTKLGWHVTATGTSEAAGAAASAQRQAAPRGRHTAAGAAGSAQRHTAPDTAAGAATGAQRGPEADPAPDEPRASAAPAETCPPGRDGPGRDGSVAALPAPPPAARACPPSPPPADDIPLPTPLPARSPRARPRGKRGGRTRGAARTTEET